jgi:hypothetical protein
LGRGWSAVTTIALSRLVPELFASAALVVLVRLCHRPLAEADEELTHRRIAAYFLPMALNTVMFALSRPIVFAFVTAAAAGGVLRTGEAAVAGLSLAFSFGMIFQGTINQIRHVFATFGRDDASGVRRFLVHVTVLVTALCLASCISPLNRWYFAHFQGAEGLVLEVALDAMWVLVLVPTVIAWRNYYHGLAMVKRRTLGMGIGGILRNVAIYLACLVLVKLGWFSHFWAAAMLVFGFATEALTVLVLGRGLHRDANRLPSVRPGVAEAGSAAA